MKVREFLQVNGLKQRELAQFLGVTEAAVSNVVKGKSYFSEENLIKILKNDRGWDTSMLAGNQPEVPAEEKPTSENPLLEYLQRKIEQLEREKEELLQENAVLRYENMMLTPRKGDAEDVASSLSANVG
jgi:transcriptional regulator with XRE-family HTH domain